MPNWVKGLLTGLLWTGHGLLAAYLLNLAFDEPLEPWGALLIGGLFGLLYGLEAGILVSYDLNGIGWLQLVVDMTWSLPNTVWGFVVGNLIFWFFGHPSWDLSTDRGWVAFKPYGSTGFGNDVKQTHGTVNLGGAGQHELLHVLQARIFGPLFLPLFLVNYVVNFVIQLLWTLTIGGILWLCKVRDTPYFPPSSSSVVSGFFGWIYYATLFELWAYGAGNP